MTIEKLKKIILLLFFEIHINKIIPSKNKKKDILFVANKIAAPNKIIDNAIKMITPRKN